MKDECAWYWSCTCNVVYKYILTQMTMQTCKDLFSTDIERILLTNKFLEHVNLNITTAINFSEQTIRSINLLKLPSKTIFVGVGVCVISKFAEAAESQI